MEEALAGVAATVVVGDGTRDGVDMGPVQNKPQLDRVESLVAAARAGGADVYFRGEAAAGPALRVPELGPPTLVSADRAAIRAAVAGWGRAVLKPTDGMAGRGILVLDPADPNLASILDSATSRGRTQVVVQQWLPESSGGDRRVIVLDGRPVGVVRRLARAGEFRCNMAAGAAAEADTVAERDREICAGLAPLLREYGLPLVGIDVIGGRLTEVNVTSPTGIREIDALTGSQLASDVICWAEERCRAAAKPA